jgi:serine/threonine protein kinase
MSNRPDLSDQHFRSFDRNEVDNHRRLLDSGLLFDGKGDELATPAIVHEDEHIIAQNFMSELIPIRIQNQWLACKICWVRSRVSQEAYQNELDILQSLRKIPHWHVVQLSCHYIKSDRDQGRFILSPLAECNLKLYLSEKPTAGRKTSVRRWFGCLAAAVENIHQQNTKHKDIKPENILIHGDNAIIADLGISNQSVECSESYGTSPGSYVWKAPEARHRVPRGHQQDMWSLLCCFIVMVSYIQGYTIIEFYQRCQPDVDRVPHFDFTGDYGKVLSWLKDLKSQTTVDHERALLGLLLSAFQLDPNERPKADDLLNGLREIGNMYVGECCVPPRCIIIPGPGMPSVLSTDP